MINKNLKEGVLELKRIWFEIKNGRELRWKRILFKMDKEMF